MTHMKGGDREGIKTELERLQKIAFEDTSINIGAIEEIYDLLRKIPVSQRGHFEKYYNALKNDLFSRGADIKGLPNNYFRKTDFFTEETNTKEEIQDNIFVSEVKENPINRKPLDFLKDFVEKCSKDFNNLREYYILKLISEEYSEFKILFIHDEDSYFQSFKKKVEIHFGNIEIESIFNWKDRLDKGDYRESSYIVILFLSHKKVELINDIVTRIKSAIMSFDTFKHVKLRFKENSLKPEIIEHNDVDEFIDLLKCNSSIMLVNSELSNDEVSLIKKLFNSVGGESLDYKVIKSGKSGAKVLEVRPKKSYAEDSAKRYVVKFGKRDESKKISIESERFAKHVEHYSLKNELTQHHDKNTNYEGIKYTYASSDNIQESFSFAEIISDDKNSYFSKLNKIAEELFESKLLEIWQESVEEAKVKIKDLYSEYIKIEKLYSQVRKIKNLGNLDKDSFVNIFDKIYNLEIDSKTKVCHGDLHTENFFKDGEGIYLIDFGFTDRRHALIDHVSLECSIKFRHIPRYIDLNVLEICERELLNDSSFNSAAPFFSVRKDLQVYFSLIKTIRSKSFSLMKNNSTYLEYFVSLFIITSRQIQYDDLNQLYALKSAEIIGNHILEILDK
ncbi:phosphotransferase [Leptospira idonii]|uniref:Uncharacterized protein n=1 Tax=Leptospira idonii TaxID=1193500 RepID=A0A4R9M2L2_9LEPT|nr:phosphotransferase [Leptospira idonii]TGN19529.1 hypothetical protein EHS15_08310 [Leptospira idonii]